nr:hypothetical protein [Tanacetum cinerariifolium]
MTPFLTIRQYDRCVCERKLGCERNIRWNKKAVLKIMEASDIAKSTDVRDLKERKFALEGEKDALSEKVSQLTFDLSGSQLSRDELGSKVTFLDSERDKLANHRSSLESTFELFKGRMEAMQDKKATAIGCAINKGIHDSLKAGVDHGKAGRDLSVIEAYDLFAEAKYVEVMSDLCNVDFSLLFVLNSKKDASIVDLIDSFRLEGPLAEIPRAEELQPSPEQLML